MRRVGSGVTDDRRARLTAALADSDAQVRALQRQHDDIVAASVDSNADDEHDPEGATIAFERQQVVALLASARRAREDVERALAQLDGGAYGTCETCGGEIGAARLEARPSARTCIGCASARR